MRTYYYNILLLIKLIFNHLNNSNHKEFYCLIIAIIILFIKFWLQNLKRINVFK